MIRGELKIVPVDEVQPNQYNPNVMSDELFEKERNSLKRFGMVRPIITRTENGKRIIVDGENRWHLFKDEGVSAIPIRDLGEISQEDAMALTFGHQRYSRQTGICQINRAGGRHSVIHCRGAFKPHSLERFGRRVFY